MMMMMMMMISRLARSTISRSRNVFNGGRSSTNRWSGGSSVYQSPYIIRQLPDDNLGFFKPYLPTNNGKHGSVNISDTNFLLPNPRMFPSFFSTENQPPKKNKNSEKEKKETPNGNNQESKSEDDDKEKETPNGNNQESKSQEEPSTEDDGSGFRLLKILLVVPVMWLAFWLTFWLVDDKQKEISFEEFKNKLLEPGLVDHIVISNKSVAKVYVRNSPRNQTTDGTIIEGYSKLKIGRGHSIESVKSFMKKLEEAQEAVGIDTHDYVPVTCVFEKDWGEDAFSSLTLAQIFVLGFLVRLDQKLQGPQQQPLIVWYSMGLFFLIINMWFSKDHGMVIYELQ